MNWIKTPYLSTQTNDFIYKSKIASFDIDGTIITTKSNNKFPINKNDWKFLYDQTTLDKLKELHDNDYCIIFISNQGGLKTDTQINDWIEKIEAVIKSIKEYSIIPILIFAATKDYLYRKPIPTLWLKIKNNLKDHNLTLSKKSFYCGDAAGRKKDHNDTDYKFAVNCHLDFKIPEMLFLNQEENKSDKINIKYPDLSFMKLNINLDYGVFRKLQTPANQHPGQALLGFAEFIPIVPPKKELILMIGYPGSGKTFLSKKFSKSENYIYINQDSQKTKAKCIKEFQKNLELNKNIVIDNLNYSKKIRSEYITLAQKYNYEIRCIVLNTSKELSKHNMLYRFYISNGETKIIPEIVYNNYRIKYEVPDSNEGIHIIQFIEFNKLDQSSETNNTNNNYFNYYY
jgi:bifunctional polynucleotide phosphatase/kinase